MAARIIDQPGSSHYFDRGFITYSNVAKIQMLDISPLGLRKYGAVSPQTAQKMAEGAIQKSQADFSVSITGIAGPEGGSAEKPVGTVYFAFASKTKKTKTTCMLFSGTRAEIREQATNTALTDLADYISSPLKTDYSGVSLKPS